MRAGLSLLLVAFGQLSAVGAARDRSTTRTPPTRASSAIYITQVTVIDTETGEEANDHTVIISGDLIAEVKDSNKVKPATGATVVDGSGKYLIPGLWDMHVHAFTFTEGSTGSVTTMPPEMYFRLAIANGVTGFRDMGGPERSAELAKLRQVGGDGTSPVPKLFAAGPVVDGPKPTWPHSLPVRSGQEGRDAVRKIKSAGFDFVKVYDGVPREAYSGIAEESREEGISFVGHVPRSITALEASSAGQKSIEHFTRVLTACSSQENEIDAIVKDAMTKGQPIFQLIGKIQEMQLASYDAPKAKSLFEAFAKNQTWQVPTFVQQRSFAYLDDKQFRTDPRLVYIPAEVQKSWDPQTDFRVKWRTPEDWRRAKQIYDKSFDIAREMHRRGVRFLAGTDLVNAYIFSGFSLHDEVALLVKAGLSNLEALQAATLNAALFMNATDKYGSVSPGKIADLVLLDADPLKDIHNTTKISEVFLAGKEFDRAALDQILKAAEIEAASPAAKQSSNPLSTSQTPPNAAKCEDLFKLSLPDVVITSATHMPAGRFIPPGSSDALEAPEFCRVVAVAKPTSDSVINFEVWIPPAAQWNHNFLGRGNGGYMGAISYGALANALQRGFAAASTDTGHSGEDLKFAAGHPEKIVDWGYRSVHIMTESAKLIVRSYSGLFPRHSYFGGCSTGGEQALSEAQRFPGDYDGVLAGDPGNDRVHLNVGFLWAFAATHDVNGKTILPTSKLPLINKAAVAACDGLDGITDGIISEPQACHFDPGVLLCKGKENDKCLTAAQVEAVKKVYAGPRNPRTGELIIAGYSPGSESALGDEYEGGWKTYITDRNEPMRLEFWRYWVFNDATWDWRTFDYDRDVTRADTKLAAVNASNPDLSAFKARGGKILMYSGWADPVGPPMDAVNYYQRVEEVMGGREKTESFFRLFMVPGMAHCRGGPGPNSIGGLSTIASPRNMIDPEHDVLSALMQWVEKGSAPDHIIAAHLTNGSVDRTRPLCPYPKIARWNGSGSSDDAKNFTCAEESSATPDHQMMK